MPRHALVGIATKRAVSLIHGALRWRRNTQIVAAIVETIAIAVVDHFADPRTGKQPMQKHGSGAIIRARIECLVAASLMSMPREAGDQMRVCLVDDRDFSLAERNLDHNGHDPSAVYGPGMRMLGQDIWIVFIPRFFACMTAFSRS